MDKNEKNIKNYPIITLDGNSTEIKGSDVDYLSEIRNHDIAIDNFTEKMNKNLFDLNNKMSAISAQPTSFENGVSKEDNNVISTTVCTNISEKKPSYLNLACCINGYSNITTYDSKIRQEINKSREVSPLRSTYNTVLNYTKNSTYASPVLLSATPNKQNETEISEPKPVQNTEETRNTSFVQERVERLYGPGAFAPNFYAQQKLRNKNLQSPNNEQNNANELKSKLKQVPYEKDMDLFKKKNILFDNQKTTYNQELIDETNDLPVLRHLSHEFRVQLTTVSPKQNTKSNASNAFQSPERSIKNVSRDETDKVFVATDLSCGNGEKVFNDTKKISNKNIEISQNRATKIETSTKEVAKEKDGNYFLEILRQEQNRLLSLAQDAEKNVEELSSQPDQYDDVLGVLRSAAGKARLLASKKMRQFEDLCYKNLNQPADEPFVTTADDLQGFWDLISIQINEINKLFEDIEAIKSNNWKKKPQENLNKQKQIPIKQNLIQSKPTICKPSAKSTAAIKRANQRKELMEIMRKNRNKIATDSSQTSVSPTLNVQVHSVEIFVNDTNNLPVKPLE